MSKKTRIVKENAHQLLLQDWHTAKSDGWTQVKMAKALEMSQPTFSQYLSNKIPLNASFLIKYSKLRRIDPKTIGVEASGPVSRVALPVRFSTLGVIFRGRNVEMAGIITEMDNAFLVEVDSNFSTFPKGSLLVCEEIAVGDGDNVVAYKETDGVMTTLVGELRKHDDNWFVVEPLASGEQLKQVDKTWAIAKITGVTLPKSEPKEMF